MLNGISKEDGHGRQFRRIGLLGMVDFFRRSGAELAQVTIVLANLSRVEALGNEQVLF
jgi:hypothetical protein